MTQRETGRPFKNRTLELKLLDGIAGSHRAEMTVLFGRRRIGKTKLLRHWSRRHKAPDLYWTGYRTTAEQLLESFSESLAAITPGAAADSGMVFRSWEDALGHLFQLAAKKPHIAVIDEFPYLVEMVPRIPTLLQRLWDEHSDSSRLILVLCGSHYHMMHEQFASPRKPLYGRAGRHIVLEEITPRELRLFLPGYSPEQIVETYGVIGGIPAYLELWDTQKPVFQNIRDLLLSSGTFFSQEAIMLIQDEIAEPRTYLGILQALGAGLKTPKQLADRTGLAINHIGKYLSTLLDLRLVRRVISEDAENKRSSRLSKYEIRDPYLRFHFHFLYPHPDRSEPQTAKWLADRIKTQFPAYIGRSAYEELARSHLATIGEAGKLPLVPQYVGRAWNRHAEIDIVAINWDDRSVMLGECKWTRKKINLGDYESLRKRAEKLTRLNGFHKHYALFSKTGFTKDLRALPHADRPLLFEGPGFRRVR